MMEIEATEAEVLRRECIAFCRALTGTTATPYVVARYVGGHAAHPFLREPHMAAVDAALIRAARRGSFSLRCADIYARFFRPGGALRRKLILLLAIAENAPAVHVQLNDAHEQSLPRALLRMASVLILSAGVLAVALLRFAPLHLAARIARAGRTLPEHDPVRRTAPVAAVRVLPQPVGHGEER